MAQSNGGNLATGQQETESQHFSPYRQDGKLYGFVCVVIGATHPIGRAITLELAAHGAACIYACTLPSSPPTTPALDPAANSSADTSSYPNTKIIPYPYAPTEETTLQLIDDVLNTHGRLDIYVTLSTLLGPDSLSRTTPSLLNQLFEANALVPFYALKYAPPAMQKLCVKGNYPNAAPKDTKYGSIIVVGSIATEVGGVWGVGYTMANHAALGVVKAGVKELKATGVRINAISHGLITAGETEPVTKAAGAAGSILGIGLERPGRAVEVARVAGFLASGFSSYITGANMVVDGGASAVSAISVPMT